MEFSRRGPATDAAADGNRFPEPPPHPHPQGEPEPTLVMRDALLSQLHMARLRQEIIQAELTKIERAMALRAATGGHQTQTTPMSMPWHGVTTADAGRSKPWPFSAEQPMADRDAEFDERKLPDSHETRRMEFSHRGPASTSSGADRGHGFPGTPSQGEREPMLVMRDALLSQLHMDRLRQEINKAELAKVERAMALLSTTASGHETTPMSWHAVVTADDGRSKPWPFSVEQPVAQQNAELDERKLPDSNKAVPPPSKTSPAEKWELTGITIPVKKPKQPMKWNCTVCQVQATCEQNIQQHYAGQKHLTNVATLDPTTKASDPKAKTAAEPSLSTEEKKTSSIKWSCSTCQAKGTVQSTLEAHLKGRRHQQNIAATSTEGDKNGMPKNVVAQEAKSHGISVSKHSKKLPSAWSCSICEVNCTCQTDLKNHFRGKRHREKVQSLLEQSKNKASDSELRKSNLNLDSRWICSICHANCACASDLENHLAGKRHQLNIQILREKIKQVKSNPTQVTENKKPSSEWNCTMCGAKCNSKSQFESHCRSSKHQQKMLAKGKVVKAISSRTANDLPS